jgi:hypothetical protein
MLARGKRPGKTFTINGVAEVLWRVIRKSRKRPPAKNMVVAIRINKSDGNGKI